MDLQEILAKAKAFNARLDQIDRHNGNPTLQEVGPTQELGVAIAAIEAGIATDQWDCIAQGLVMLYEVRISMLENAKAMAILAKDFA